jgi:hypothetical protein
VVTHRTSRTRHVVVVRAIAWPVVLWWVRGIVVVVVMVVVVVVPIIATIPPVVVVVVIAHVPVPVVPRVARISPPRVVEWVYRITPAIVPGRGVDAKGDVSGAPRTKHRGYIAWLHPHLVTRHHNIVVGRIVCRGVHHSATCEQVVVARREVVCCRLEAVETTCIGALIVVSHNI